MNNILLCGFMGCGKTTVGKRLAALTGREYIDLDHEIELEAGMTIRLPPRISYVSRSYSFFLFLSSLHLLNFLCFSFLSLYVYIVEYNGIS